jgi:hypothetical protein
MAENFSIFGNQNRLSLVWEFEEYSYYWLKIDEELDETTVK